MPIIKNVGDDVVRSYEGYSRTKVGAGTVDGVYASPKYAKKKIQTLLLGGLSSIVYSGYDHDLNPLILSFKLVPQYNCVMGANLRYIPKDMRKAVIKFVLEANSGRIKSNQPMITDYDMLVRNFPFIKYITRLYKTPYIRVDESFRLVDWEKAVTETSNKWQGHYKMIQEGTIR